MYTMSGTLTSTTTDDGVTTITFGHPAHNSIPSPLLADLVAALDAAGADAACRVVLLRSAGERTFCAGANFDELLSIGDFATGRAFFMGFAGVILAMRRCPKPVVVAVQGKAVGGGVGIAAAADYCFATRYASVKLSELAIAIGPFVILPAVARKIGVAAATELSLDTEWHDPDWAAARGLYQRVFPTQDEMMAAARALCAKLAGYSPEAAAQLKQTLWADTDHWPELLTERAGVSGRLVLGEAARTALAKFKGRSD